MLMSAYSIIPPDATTHRAGMVSPARFAVEGREIYAAALLGSTQFIGELPAQAESVRDLASRVDQARERQPVALLGLEAVVRRLMRDND